jgi:pyrophosphatase PpaX
MSKCVLFDLDGTIVDTNELIIETLSVVLLEQCGLTFEREQLIPHMGRPLTEQFMEFSKRTEVEDLVAAYRVYNLKRHDEMVGLFPNVLEVVRQLDAEGFKLGVVTTKARESSNRVLKMFGLIPYMETIVTIDDITYPKPHPEPVLKAMRDLSADPAQTWMVGDSPADMGAAKAAGVTAVGVSWSLKASEVLQASGADVMIHDMEDLYELCGVKKIHR